MKIKKCPECQIDFIITRNNRSNKFCSHSCAITYNNKRRPRYSDEQKENISKGLKKYWENNPDKRKISNEHYNKIIEYTKHKYKRKDIQSILDLTGRTVTKILKRLNLGCCVCGWKEGTCDVHHILGRKIENPDNHDNLTYLCPNHHRLAHEKKVTLDKLIPLSKYLPDNWMDFYYG